MGCGEKGHMQRDCPKGKASGKREQGNYASTSRDASEGRSERMFVMQHVMNTMTTENHAKYDAWYVDSGADPPGLVGPLITSIFSHFWANLLFLVNRC